MVHRKKKDPMVEIEMKKNIKNINIKYFKKGQKNTPQYYHKGSQKVNVEEVRKEDVKEPPVIVDQDDDVDKDSN